MKVIGEGSYGVTYLAEDLHCKRNVAVKEHFPNLCSVRSSSGINIVPLSGMDGAYQKSCARFRTEAEILARFVHQNVVTIYAIIEENQTFYFVMELLEGRCLDQQLGLMPAVGFRVESGLRLMREVLIGLSAVHEKECLHLDIKPSNIFLTNCGEVKIIDFGSARSIGSSNASALYTAGTPGYAAPEMYSRHGDISYATDVYACGAVMYEMFSGEAPVPADQRVNSTWNPGHVLESNLPASLVLVIEKALSYSPSDRYQGSLDMLMALLRLGLDPNLCISRHFVAAAGAVNLQAGQDGPGGIEGSDDEEIDDSDKSDPVGDCEKIDESDESAPVRDDEGKGERFQDFGFPFRCDPNVEVKHVPPANDVTVIVISVALAVVTLLATFGIAVVLAGN